MDRPTKSNFIDYTTIDIISGNGGAGCVSFRREKYAPKGGPNGGDGGNGGDVILKTSEHVSTLLDLKYKRLFKAENGAPGQGNEKSGKSGKNKIIFNPQFI